MADQSFEDFVHVSLPTLSRYAHALTGAADRGEDLVQDTLVKVARAWRRIRHDGNALAYARKTMFNTYLSAWSKLRRHATVPLSDDRASPDAYGQIDSRDELRRALAGLPRDQRAVLVLGYLDDLSDDRIAEMLDRRPATIRSLRHRGLQALRAHFVDFKREGRHV